MANRVAWLTKRVKIGGQWFVRKPIIKTSGFVTERVEHNGQPIHAPGTFVLELYENGKRQRKPLTESTLEAQDALRKKSQTLEARSPRGRGSIDYFRIADQPCATENKDQSPHNGCSSLMTGTDFQ